MVIANHIAPLLGLETDRAAAPASLTLANGVRVQGPARTRELIMDGNIGAQVLNDWILTLDLARGRAWIAPVRGELPASGDPPRD